MLTITSYARAAKPYCGDGICGKKETIVNCSVDVGKWKFFTQKNIFNQ